MSTVHGLLWQAYFHAKRFPSTWTEFDEFACQTDVTAQSSMGQQLLSRIKYFGTRADTLPEWKDASRIDDPTELMNIWSDLPILTKDDLRNRFHPEEIQERFDIDGVISSTGGSTGEPAPFLRDRDMLRRVAAANAYCHLRLGWKPGMAVVCVWGSERDIGKQRGRRARVSAKLRNFYLVDGYEMNDGTVSRLRAAIDRHAPVAVYGFTSMLEYVARQLVESGDVSTQGKVKTAWNGGETLHPLQSELFKRAFGVPILNLYGGRELGAMAYQSNEGAPLKVLRPHLMLEVLDRDGKPATPGDIGRLVWTSTLCTGTPFLRYDNGDLGRAMPGHTDELGVSVLAEIVGRQSNVLRLPTGRTIHGLFWNHLFKDYPEIFQFQVALVNEETLELRLRGKRISDHREQQLLHTLHEFTGQCPIDIKWLDRIPLTSQGKLIQVVQEPR